MTANVSDLIDGRPFPTCVKMADSINAALELMIENDFSQLPVIDDDRFPKGLITSDSILRGLANLGATVKQLLVRDVIEKHVAVRVDVSVLDSVASVKDRPAVLVTDGDGRLIGIVTNADTAEYFRRHAEDMMLVQDIETAIQDHIEAAFTNSKTGNIDTEELQLAIDEVFNAQTKKIVSEAINRYHTHFDGEKSKTNLSALEKVREALAIRGKMLDDLTLSQLIDLMLHKRRWQDYGKNFSAPADALRTFLSDITDIRNTLAHFRDELTPTQQEKLRWCAEWFQRNPPTFPDIPLTVTEMGDAIESIPEERETSPLVEPLSEIDSRYAKLALHLQEQTVERVRLSLKDVENIIGSSLPPSAYEHRSWWANDSTSHSQSQQWLDAGWRVSSINMSEGAVTFVRAKEREAAYIEFFAPLLKELKQKAPFSVRDDTLIGTNWIHMFSAYDPNSQYTINYSFTLARGHRFRVELYIYAPYVDDKRVFDRLVEQRSQIEQEFGESLIWERLEGTKAARIALYRPGHITDSSEELDNIRSWGVEAIIRLEKATHERVNTIIKTL